MKKNVRNLGITRINILRIVSLSVIMAFIIPVMTNAQAGKVNFAGTWALNPSKSDMGQPPAQGQGQGQRMGGGLGSNFVAKQEANLLTVESTRINQDGETITITSKYTLDGKESINTTPRGESKSIAKWSADGKTLTIVTTRTFDMNGETRTMTSTQVWSLTDANTLSIFTTATTPNGERKTTAVYDKK
jgi:hypothetical protein